MSSFIEHCRELIDEHGVPKAADYVVDEHDSGACDAIEGFLGIEANGEDFWQLDHLASEVVRRVKRLDLREVIELCVKMQALGGRDLAAGMLYNSLESYLSSRPDEARMAFDIVLGCPDFDAALPCATRALSRTELAYVCEKLMSKESLAAVFSLQFCVSDDENVRKTVEKYLTCLNIAVEEANVKRAQYLSAKAWGFCGLMNRLLESGSPSVLRVAVTELADPSKLLDREPFVRHLGYFDKVPKDYEIIWERLDRVMQIYYSQFPDVCMRFVCNHLTKDGFPNFVRHLAHDVDDGTLLEILMRLLASGQVEKEFLAFRVASKVVLNRAVPVSQRAIDEISCPYAFRKCLGWLYGKPEVCLPLCLSLIANMNAEDMSKVEDIFFDPLCLHYTDRIASLLNDGVVFADSVVEKSVRKILERAQTFYKELNAKGPCNELHPNPDMIVIARRKQAEQMSTAFRKVQKESVLGMLCGDHAISLLHGGKMIFYSSDQDPLSERKEVPLSHHSVSIKMPSLLTLAGSLLEDRLLMFRREHLR